MYCTTNSVFPIPLIPYTTAVYLCCLEENKKSNCSDRFCRPTNNSFFRNGKPNFILKSSTPSLTRATRRFLAQHLAWFNLDRFFEQDYHNSPIKFLHLSPLSSSQFLSHEVAPGNARREEIFGILVRQTWLERLYLCCMAPRPIAKQRDDLTDTSYHALPSSMITTPFYK